MENIFELPVTYKGENLHFPAALLQFGYTHKFQVDVYGTDVLFEPDEERSYRAVVDPEELPRNFDTALLNAIAQAIHKVLE